MSQNAFRSKFTLWILEDKKTTQPEQQTIQSFEQKLKPLSSFSSIQQFWQVFQYMSKPSKISEQSDIYLFRDGIKPLWEDPQNQKGGYYTIKIQKQKMDKVWENAVFSLISPMKQVATCINGVRVKIKQQFCILQIWMNAKAPQNLVELKQYLKDSLQITDDRVYAFFYFSYLTKGIKGKQTYNKDATKQEVAKDGPRQYKQSWKNGSKQPYSSGYPKNKNGK